MTVRFYKLTDPKGGPVHGGSGEWPLPGEGPGAWRSVKGDIVPCENGLHLLTVADIRNWLREGVLWEAEPAARTRTIRDTDKTVVRKARLIRQVAVIDRRLLVTFAADCADHVLPMFEKRYPDDNRPRAAIEAVRGWLAGTVSIEQVQSAAAASAAAYAASAAAAAYAAYAAYAAAAASAAERRWQAQHLAELLGIPWEES